MRDYLTIGKRLEQARQRGWQVQTVARLHGLPVFSAARPGTPDRTALVSGGTHGDEPAGVEACLRAVEEGAAGWPADLGVEVLPCLNPFGYVHRMRHNAQGVDVNWSYSRADVPEVRLLRRLVHGRRFEFVFDCHEDWESPGYYVYELRRGAPLMGHQITRRVSQVCPVNTDAEIEGLPATGGLIAPDADEEVARRGAGIPLAMYFEHTDHLLTSESPTELDMNTRVAAHLAALAAVVDDYRGH